MLNVFEVTDQQKLRIKTPEKISLLTLLSLMYLVGNNSLLLIKSTKKTITTKEILGTMINKDEVRTKTHLQQILTLSPKRKKRIFLTSNSFFAKRKANIPASVLKKKTQKTSVNLIDLYVNDYN